MWRGWRRRRATPTACRAGTEWEYVARAGTKEARPFGQGDEALCKHANVHDRASYEAADFDWLAAECDDGHVWTAPVGSYPANAFGVFDLLGNVAEWVEDCWNPNYVGAPRNARARVTGDCTRHVSRGGSWAHSPETVTVLEREIGGPFDYQGFRAAPTLPD